MQHGKENENTGSEKCLTPYVDDIAVNIQADKLTVKHLSTTRVEAYSDPLTFLKTGVGLF